MFLSHIECIKIAKENKMKNIFVIEDDCIPYHEEKNFEERLCKIKKILDTNNNWDIFLGGANIIYSHNITDILHIDDENFILSDKGKMTHMICYNESSYDFFLTKNVFTSHPIDVCWHYKLKALIPTPFIAEQLSSYSNIQNKKLNLRKCIKNTNDNILKYIIDKKNQ